MASASNISLRIWRKFLESKGLKHIRDNGGHEIWSRADLPRPVVFQSHIEPIPPFVVSNNLKIIGASKAELMSFIKEK